MAFFTVKANAESVRDFTGNGGKYLTQSGMYEITIKNLIVSTSANGSTQIDMFINHAGQDQMLFGAIRLTNNDGSPNLSADLFNKLLVILGATDNDVIEEPVPMKLPVGKGGEMKEVMVLDQEGLKDVPVFLRLQMQYSLFNDDIQERKVIRNFFRYEDKATASEIVNNAEAGKQYEKEAENATKRDLKDGLTDEDVDTWLANRRSGSSTATKEAKKPSSFGSKRTFGKK